LSPGFTVVFMPAVSMPVLAATGAAASAGAAVGGGVGGGDGLSCFDEHAVTRQSARAHFMGLLYHGPRALDLRRPVSQAVTCTVLLERSPACQAHARGRIVAS
jgi:hypothetical protein